MLDPWVRVPLKLKEGKSSKYEASFFVIPFLFRLLQKKEFISLRYFTTSLGLTF